MVKLNEDVLWLEVTVHDRRLAMQKLQTVRHIDENLAGKAAAQPGAVWKAGSQRPQQVGGDVLHHDASDVGARDLSAEQPHEVALGQAPLLVPIQSVHTVELPPEVHGQLLRPLVRVIGDVALHCDMHSNATIGRLKDHADNFAKASLPDRVAGGKRIFGNAEPAAVLV